MASKQFVKMKPSKGPDPNFFRFPKPIEGTLISWSMVLFYFSLYDPSHAFLDYMGPIGTFSRYMSKNHYGLLQIILYCAVATHALEAVYAAVLCRRHGISAPVTVAWMVQTFIIGFPSLTQLTGYRPDRKTK